MTIYFEGLQKSRRLASISTVILEMNLNENHLLFVSIPTPQVRVMFIHRPVYEQPSWCLHLLPIATVTTIRVQCVLPTDGLGLAVEGNRVPIMRCRTECLCSFTLRCSSSLSCTNEYLAIDSGGYLCTSVLTALPMQWLG